MEKQGHDNRNGKKKKKIVQIEKKKTFFHAKQIIAIFETIYF